MDIRKISIAGGLLVLMFVFGLVRAYAGDAVKNAFIDSIYNGVFYFSTGVVLAGLLVLVAAFLRWGLISEGFGGIGKNWINLLFAVVLGVVIILLRYGIVFRTHFLLSPSIPIDVLTLTVLSRTLEIMLLAVFVVGIILPIFAGHWSKWTAVLAASFGYLLLQLGELLVSRGVDKIIAADVGLALITAMLMYIILCYSRVRTGRNWFALGFITSWSVADYLVFKLLRPDTMFYNDLLDAGLVVFLLITTFFISKRIFSIEVKEQKKEEDRFRPKHNWR